MTPRKRIKLALEYKKTDRIPIGYFSTLKAKENLKEYLDIKNDNKLLRRLGVDYRFVYPDYVGPKDLHLDFNWDYPGKDIWGIERREVSNSYGSYMEISKFPLKDVKDVKELEKYPWPRIEWFDFDSVTRQIEELEDEYCIILNGGSVFEQSWFLRDMEQFLVDLLLNPDIANKIIEKVFHFYTSVIYETMNVIGNRIDMIFFGDDVASQNGMLISVDTWKKWVKPWHEKFYAISHDFGGKTIYHSCGAITPIIENLIEIGLDVLNPLQFSAKGFPSAEELKEKYGDRLCFLGGMDVQTVLPLYSPEEIVKETERLIRVLGKGGGYIMQTTHNIQADVPPKNIMAMYDTALNYTY